MGNSPSHPATPAGGTPATSANTDAIASNSTAAARTSAVPISAPGSTAAPTTAPAFHSGLTPPQRTPSPPPPSTPPLLPYGGHLSPQNPHALSLPQASDYSKTVVTRLIMEARLAPFYRGLEDYEEDWTEEVISKLLDEIRDQDVANGVSNSVTEASKTEKETSGVGSMAKKIGMQKAKNSRREEEKDERDKREKRAYMGATECPICFLSYPPNINTSRCCQQPICTECFVQIKRSEATLTHLESEPASCPFCVETDFGVIYERPNIPTPLSSTSALASSSALSVSPEAGTSGLSRTLDLSREDAELSIGVGMAPKAQETVRRKSVSHKSKEVVTIDEIRPDWEMKLNAVKAAAARKASRRIVMRQVGDRLIPIGFTSSRATGTADFSMSVGSGANSGSATPSTRDRRRGSGRERDLEELMIMEAMRLSLIDHEEHMKSQTDTNTASNAQNDFGPIIQQERAVPERAPDRRKFSLSVPGQSGGSSSRRASESSTQAKHEKSGSTASKFFNKIANSGNRSRSGSTASSLKAVSFSNSTTHLGLQQQGGPSRSSPVPPSPRPTTPSPPILVNTQTTSSPIAATHNLGRSPPSSLGPQSPSPIAPVTTLANHNSINNPSPQLHTSTPLNSAPSVPAPAPVRVPTPVDESSRTANTEAPTLPRLSLDMPPLVPDHPDDSTSKTGQQAVIEHRDRQTLNRADTGLSVMTEVTEAPSYAQLDSDEER